MKKWLHHLLEIVDHCILDIFAVLLALTFIAITMKGYIWLANSVST